MINCIFIYQHEDKNVYLLGSKSQDVFEYVDFNDVSLIFNDVLYLGGINARRN